MATGVAQGLGDDQRPCLSGVPDRDHRDLPRRRRRLGNQHRQPLDPGGPADSGQRRAAHDLDQPVVTSAAHDRALRAEIGGNELESRVSIVIETAHQTGVETIADPQPVQPVAHPREKIPRSGIQVLLKSGRADGDPLVGLVLRIEDSQRVAIEPAQAVRGQLRGMRRKISYQRLPIGGAALRVAERVEFENRARAHSQRVEDAAAECDDLNVGLGLRHTDQLDPDLVELAKPALLRPLIAKHRAVIEKFDRRVLNQAVRENRTHHPGGIFRPQRHLFAAPVGEGVHLLGDDIRGLANRAGEDLGELENRRRDLGKPI